MTPEQMQATADALIQRLIAVPEDVRDAEMDRLHDENNVVYALVKNGIQKLQPVHVCVGTEPKTQVAFRVLEYSIKKHTKRAVLVTPLSSTDWQYSLEGIKVGTGFSLRRWMIPEYYGFKGRHIYLDADQLVFGDIGELDDYGRTGTIACTRQVDKWSPKKPVPQTSVMVINGTRAGSHHELGAKTADFWTLSVLLKVLRENNNIYGDLMHATWIPSQEIIEIPTAWNSLNVYEAGKTKLLHYTKEPEQPWVKPSHPLAHLWQEALKEAIVAGAVPRAEFEQALSKWGVKEDWRNTNGLHPSYRSFLKLYP